MSATMAQERPAQAGTAIAQLRGVGRMTAAGATKERGANTVSAFFEANKNAIATVLPRHMTAERMMKIAMRCLRTTPKLMDCKLDSLFGATITCAQLGLEPNTPQGHIYLIPFGNEVNVVIGYKGLIDLARRSGQIVSISARVRHEHDEWDMSFGTEEGIRHVPAEGDRGRAVGYYAVAKLKDGGVQFEYMTKADVERVRQASPSRNSSPWKEHFDEMGRKTVIRRLAKYLPMSIELATAVELDGAAEAGKGQNLANVIDGTEYTVQSDDAPNFEANDLSGSAEAAPGAAAALSHDNAPPAVDVRERERAPAEVGHDPDTGELHDEDRREEPVTQRGAVGGGYPASAEEAQRQHEEAERAKLDAAFGGSKKRGGRGSGGNGGGQSLLDD